MLFLIWALTAATSVKLLLITAQLFSWIFVCQLALVGQSSHRFMHNPLRRLASLALVIFRPTRLHIFRRRLRRLSQYLAHFLLRCGRIMPAIFEQGTCFRRWCWLIDNFKLLGVWKRRCGAIIIGETSGLICDLNTLGSAAEDALGLIFALLALCFSILDGGRSILWYNWHALGVGQVKIWQLGHVAASCKLKKLFFRRSYRSFFGALNLIILLPFATSHSIWGYKCDHLWVSVSRNRRPR